MSASSSLRQVSWGWGRTKKDNPDVGAFDKFPWYLVYALCLSIPFYLLFSLFGLTLTWFTLFLYVVTVVVVALPVLAVTLVAHSYLSQGEWPYQAKYVTFCDKEFEGQWKGKKIPILVLYDAYFDGKVDIEGDLLEALYDRYSFASFVFTWGHVTYFLGKLIPELLAHTKKQDDEQVTDHYNRGNDFYNSFLGETMVYTSGIFLDENDTLEQSQINKLNLVANKIHLKKGEKHLDIGCGWGTLVKHFAKEYGTDSTGVTLAKEQTKWAEGIIKKAKVEKTARILTMDYRDIPEATQNAKFDKITCLEMAEHVGVKYFQSFMRQVRDMLKDDGIFYLQIAGLRRAWQYEDLMWGCFMGNYVFPGADASCPLGWVINQAESAGFEVHTVETIGIHYSATIKRWYDNWMSNKDFILKKYGKTWFRKWEWFLAWSVISPEQGSATCYQIVLHKNTSTFDRKRYIAERANWSI